MPTTVHKILIRDPQSKSEAILPIGQLSEEAQEARNKDFRKYRESYCRKSSPLYEMSDIFHRYLVTSDPYISCIRPLSKKKFKNFSKEMLQLLEELVVGIYILGIFFTLNQTQVNRENQRNYGAGNFHRFKFSNQIVINRFLYCFMFVFYHILLFLLLL